MREIQLTNGGVAIIDDEDFEELSKHKWHCSYGYARRSISTGVEIATTISMHVSIVGRKSGLEVDHVNGDKLDNRRENLRHCTHRQNRCNATSDTGTSRYKGVYWDAHGNKWRSQIMIDGKRYNLGLYKSERDAAWVYNVWAESFFGEYSRLNALG